MGSSYPGTICSKCCIKFVLNLTEGLQQKYALRPHPGSYSETSPYNGVTLACTRDQEAVSISIGLISFTSTLQPL